MSKPQFQMIEVKRTTGSEHNPTLPGFYTTYTDPTGGSTTTHWTSPPDNLTDIERDYLQQRHPNIVNQKRLAYYIKEFNEYMALVKAGDLSRINTKNIDFAWYIDTLKVSVDNMLTDIRLINLSDHELKALILAEVGQIMNDDIEHYPETLKHIPDILTAQHAFYYPTPKGLIKLSAYDFAMKAMSLPPGINHEAIGLINVIDTIIEYYDETLESMLDAQYVTEY